MADAHVRAEAAVAELAQLVDELRGGGFLERGRVLARGARLLRALTPAQRRTVAIEVARQAAPQLVERIAAEGGPAGDVDLSPAQVKAVFDMVARLDSEGAGELSTRLRDPEWQREALGLLATEGLDEVARSVGFDEVPALLGDEAAASDDRAQDERDPIEATDHAPNPAQAGALAAAAGDAQQGDGIGDDLVAAAEEARRRQAEAEAPPEFAGPPASYEPTMPELAGYAAAGIDPSLLSFGAPSAQPTSANGPASSSVIPPLAPPPPTTVTPRAPDATASGLDSERSWFTDTDLGVAHVDAEATPLSRRLLDVERPSARLRMLNGHIDEFAALDAEGQLGVLLALPDGWVRRRALHRLLEADGVHRPTASRLLQTLGHDIDRAWVAASLVEHGTVVLDDVADVLSPRARLRLAARYDDRED